jgi:hypothetical protein
MTFREVVAEHYRRNGHSEEEIQLKMKAADAMYPAASTHRQIDDAYVEKMIEILDVFCNALRESTEEEVGEFMRHLHEKLTSQQRKN